MKINIQQLLASRLQAKDHRKCRKMLLFSEQSNRSKENRIGCPKIVFRRTNFKNGITARNYKLLLESYFSAQVKLTFLCQLSSLSSMCQMSEN